MTYLISVIMATSSFLDKYFECVDAMPQDLQRHVTQLREIEMEKRDLFLETERLRSELVKAVESGSKHQLLLFRQLQECLLEIREVGNSKLETSAEMLDTAEEYTQQLGLCAKDLENNPRGEDLFHTPRYNSSHYSSFKGESPMSNGLPESKTAVKRTSSSKRPRQPAVASNDRGHDDDLPLFPNGGSVGKEGVVNRSKEGGLSMLVAAGGMAAAGGGGGGGGNGKPPKKKVKTVKKNARATVAKEKETPPPTAQAMPMPDLTSQPLDPDEPTYCLCQQVSFGEMIGCDNDDCQFEWFHFQCVGLTSKPKGKWYCPNCTQERKAKTAK